MASIAAVIILVLLAVIAVTVLYDARHGSPDPKYSAFLAARSAVKQRLVAPASAKFPEDTVRVTKPSPGSYTVMGKVDSQNRLGVMLRTSYIVFVKADGDFYHATGGCIDDTMWGYDPDTNEPL